MDSSPPVLPSGTSGTTTDCPWSIEWGGDIVAHGCQPPPGSEERRVASISVHQQPYFLVLHGRGTIECLQGQFSVHGYKVTEQSQQDERSDAVPFDCPNWMSGVTIQVAHVPTRIRVTFDSPEVSVLDGKDPTARATRIPPSWWSAAEQTCAGYRTFQEAACYDDPFAHRELAPDEGEEEDAINTETRDGFIVAVSGGKGVGKSNCGRYTVHRLFEYTPLVAVLDADVGQPELGPPGTLTLSLIDTPMTVPPHRNLLYKDSGRHDVICQYFFGAETAQADPEAFIQCVAELRRAYSVLLKDHPDLPLVVNLDGWVKGLGYQVLVTLLENHLRPNFVFQILGDLKSRQFTLDRLSSAIRVLKCYSYNTAPDVVEENVPDYIVQQLDLRTATLGIPAHALRAQRLITYFLQDETLWDRVRFDSGIMQDPYYEIANRLASARPYVVPMEAVQCFCTSSDIGRDCAAVEQTMWRVLNGSVVALCYQREHDRLPRHIGLGIVRSIDPVQRIFYILTPVPAAELQSVAMLLHGSLFLPSICLYRGPKAQFSPYLSFAKQTDYEDVIGADPMKSRNSIGRKYLQGNC